MISSYKQSKHPTQTENEPFAEMMMQLSDFWEDMT